eukprot:m51a1_g6711 hypothetical protein (220) ;mRNA; r:127583-128242
MLWVLPVEGRGKYLVLRKCESPRASDSKFRIRTAPRLYTDDKLAEMMRAGVILQHREYTLVRSDVPELLGGRPEGFFKQFRRIHGLAFASKYKERAAHPGLEYELCAVAQAACTDDSRLPTAVSAILELATSMPPPQPHQAATTQATPAATAVTAPQPQQAALVLPLSPPPQHALAAPAIAESPILDGERRWLASSQQNREIAAFLSALGGAEAMPSDA